MAEGNKLFRQKSIDNIESPEVLDQYLRVTSPGGWVLIGAVIVLLIGVLIWGAFGHIDSTTSVAVVNAEGETVCLVPQNALEAVIARPVVSIDGTEYSLFPATLSPFVVTEDMNVYTLLAGNLMPGDVVYPIAVDSSVPEGISQGTLVTEQLTPLKLILN